MSTKIIFEKLGIDGIESLKVYQKNEGYEGLKKALELTPDDLIEYVKKSGLRGRGGAGFPTGLKWSFVPKNPGKPKYLCVNCDESEPGTCKDRDMVTYLPHQLLEGIAICCYAVGIEKAFIYIRGEMLEGAEILEKAVAEAEKKKFLGKNIMGKGFNLDVVVHRGAGAYICGEESALLSSLEGERGFPRLKPPFPAVEGLYACPTVINNVETLSTLPAIMRKGAEWYSSFGTEKSKGTRVLCLSGHVNKPGNYELELGTSMRELIEVHGGGVMGGELKAIIPGGASAPLLTKDHLDVTLDFEAIAEAGSMAGSGAVIIINDKTCIVKTCLNLDQFFEEESCGKCTPCREGTRWLVDILTRMVDGRGREEDIGLLKSVCDNLLGKSFCPLGDSATSCVLSAFKYFPEEFEHYAKHGCSMLDAEKEMAAN
ncbi:MAG: NADH-quinone oxidoreductase subunit NuoF [Vulcanimicrobiota bacterium]